jgi:site-specific recombinase XerD
MNFQALIGDFTQALGSKGRAKATIIAYKKDLEQFVEYLHNQKIQSPIEIEQKHIELFLSEIQIKYNLTLKTVSRKINSIRTFFKYLLTKKLVKENLSLKIIHPQLIPHAPRILSSLEYRAIRDAARLNIKYYTMIELILQTGIRISELSALKVKDVNFISDTKATLSISAYSSVPKRTIELNQMAVIALKEYFEKVINNKKGTEDALFFTKNGGGILIRNIRAGFEGIFKKAGIKGITVNDLRNTFIVYQLQNGVPLAKVAEVVGHQKLATTERYLKLLEKEPERLQRNVVPL